MTMESEAIVSGSFQWGAIGDEEGVGRDGGWPGLGRLADVWMDVVELQSRREAVAASRVRLPY